MTGDAGLILDRADALAALGPEWDPLFAAAPGLQTARPWLAASAEAALPAGAHARFVTVRGPDGPLALFPMAEGPGPRFASLTTPYTCLYQPLLRPGGGSGLDAACRAFGHLCRRWPLTRFEALDPAWEGLPVFVAGLRAAGLAIRTFDHFVNWFGEVPDSGWEGYLAARQGTLRETIRRKSRAAARDGLRIAVIRDRDGLADALDAYEQVYRRSWKEPEPFPRFNGALVQRLADTGALRIGLLWRGDVPIAAQYWTVTGGTATVLKLAHDERFKPLSPGTVLTAATIKDVIQRDGVRVLDFGRGDDAYKRGWTGSRRMRIGLLACDPRRPAGLSPLLRHDSGRALRGLRQWSGQLGHRIAGINRFLTIRGDTDGQRAHHHEGRDDQSA